MERIPESELIINPDGSIYHLGLKPGEVAPIVITVGDPDRVPIVSAYLDEVYIKVHRREIVTHTGRLGNKDITIISTGMGTDNIDIVLNELDAVVNIDFRSRQVKEDLTRLKIIRLGTSGTIHEDIPLDSILVSEYAIGYDGLLGFYQYPPHPLDHIVLPEIGKIRGTLTPGSAILLKTVAKNLVKGVTYTASGFYAPQGRQIRAKLSDTTILQQLQQIQLPGNRRVTNIEMETAGLYGLGYALGHEVISVSAILAQRISGTFSKDPGKAVNHLVETCLRNIADEL